MKPASIRLPACAGVLAALIAPALAQDNSAGQRIAQQGSKGAAACVSCHGAQGEGIAASGFPRIAGLPARYFVRQMQSFASGARNNPVMTPIAKALDGKEIDQVAAYYASLKAPPQAAGAGSDVKATPASLKQAARLAAVGDDSRQLQACANCHGPGGVGEAPAIPWLAGQHPAYLANALREWRSGARKTDPSGQMPAIARKLTDTDIAGLAAWYGRLQPAPGALTQAMQRAVAPPARPAAGTGAAAGAGPATGTGSEQGTGQTGGSQGAGGTGETAGAPQRKP